MIADAAIAGYRRKEIGKLVGETDEHIQVLTSALKKVITEGYGNELKLEKEAMNEFYRTNIKEFGRQEPLTVILVKRDWANDLAEIQKKNNAAVAYGKVMDAIARGHQKLYDSRNKWSNKTLVKELSPEISNLDESTLEVSKAFRLRRENAQPFIGPSVSTCKPISWPVRGGGDYRFAHWDELSAAERKRLEELQWTLMNYSSDFTAQALSLVVDDLQGTLSKIRGATAQAPR